MPHIPPPTAPCTHTCCLMQIDGELSPAASRVVSVHCLRSPAHCRHSSLPATGVKVCVSECACVCTHARVSLPRSEMTLRDAAILPETVNIIQYQPTGINTLLLLVLLLAEMCCCFSLLGRQHFFLFFFATTCFLLGMCRMTADGRDLPQERLSQGEGGGGGVLSRLWSGRFFVRSSDDTVQRLHLFCKKTGKYCRWRRRHIPSSPLCSPSSCATDFDEVACGES